MDETSGNDERQPRYQKVANQSITVRAEMERLKQSVSNGEGDHFSIEVGDLESAIAHHTGRTCRLGV